MLIAELDRHAQGVAYDEQPMPDLDSEAIDFAAASESFEPVRRLHRTDLETLRLVTAHQGRTVPTVGGVLLFGVDRDRQFPDAWIQAGRFAGSDRSRIVDRVEIRTPLPQAVEEAVAFVDRHTLHGAEIGALRRRERPSLPPLAVREAVVNAVAHADYAQLSWARRSGSRSSMIGSRWRVPVCCRSDSPSRICLAGCPSCAIG